MFSFEKKKKISFCAQIMLKNTRKSNDKYVHKMENNFYKQY